MRVLLINPPYRQLRGEPRTACPPLGLAYMAAVLEADGHEVRILDSVVEGFQNEGEIDGGERYYGLDPGQILGIVGRLSPRLVGISCLFSTLDPIVRALACAIKRERPRTWVVLGGSHPTVMPERLIRQPGVDFIIRGEGEVGLRALANALERGQKLGDLPNLCWVDGGRVRMNPVEFIADLDQLPMPARHLLEMERYIEIGRMHGVTDPGKPTAPLITSRGCPGTCIFCAIHPVWGTRYRAHSVDRVMAEIDLLRRDYGISHLLFEDDNLTWDRARARSLFERMAAYKPVMTWDTPNGLATWTLDDDLLRTMERSGCRRVVLAVESGDNQILREVIRKPVDLDQVPRLVHECRRLGIQTRAFFVIGLPGDTRASLERSMRYAVSLPVDGLDLMAATPYPGTPLYHVCEERGYFRKGFCFDEVNTHTASIETEEFSAADVEALIRKTVIRHRLAHPLIALNEYWSVFCRRPACSLVKALLARS